MSKRDLFVASVAAVIAVVGLAGPAAAGPPLLCHPFDIGGASSLPWDGSRAFWQGRPDYPVANVVSDTESLLTPAVPVIVRMETLRRAALYASRDADVAARLYSKIDARTRQAGRDGRPDALASFDLAYLTETYRQIADADRFMPELRGRGAALLRIIEGRDGYGMLTKVLARGGDDPAMEFAAALMRGRRDDAGYRMHAERAKAGADRDALLARNIDHIS
jgi:hypothetical protein